MFIIFTGLTDDKAQDVSQQYEANIGVLSRGALSQTLMVNQLIDIEWKFGGQYMYNIAECCHLTLSLPLVLNKKKYNKSK